MAIKTVTDVNTRSRPDPTLFTDITILSNRNLPTMGKCQQLATNVSECADLYVSRKAHVDDLCLRMQNNSRFRLTVRPFL